MVFDVESIGLHGEAFAVGYVVVDSTGAVLVSESFSCPPEAAAGRREDREWVAQHCPPLEATHGDPFALRYHFWQEWRHWKGRGAVLVADCAWPVEARFLISCVDDHHEQRRWEGPYPLHELASFMVAAGMDPMATYERLDDEPQHDPLGDAKQSARLLVQALRKLKERGATPAG